MLHKNYIMGCTMNQHNWLVKKALPEDLNRWLSFASTVTKDFYNIDLPNDEKYRFVMIKNITRKTAIYVEDEAKENCPIIGAMTYSPNQNHISWLAVHPDYRNAGVASALMNSMSLELSGAKEIKVKTFHIDDMYGKAARSFYRKHGFIAGEILLDDEFPHPVQVFTKRFD